MESALDLRQRAAQVRNPLLDRVEPARLRLEPLDAPLHLAAGRRQLAAELFIGALDLLLSR